MRLTRKDICSGLPTQQHKPRLSTFLSAGLMLASLLPACNESDRTTPAQNGIWSEPYKGNIVQDESGNYYMAKRFIVKFNDDVSAEDSEAILSAYPVKITGYIKPLNSYEVEVVGGLDTTITTLNENSHVEVAERNYFFTPANWDNEQYGGPISPPHCQNPALSLDERYQNGLWWSNQIRLTAGLDLFALSSVKKTPVTVAVIDSGFNLNNTEINYVDKQYHWDFADNDSNTDATKTEMFPLLHGDRVCTVLSAANNNLRTNGMLPLNIFSVLPLKVNSEDLLNQLSIATGRVLTGDDFRIAAAITYSAAISDVLGVKVINLSMGWPHLPSPTSLTQYALYHARFNGLIVVSAAGNSSQPVFFDAPASLGTILVGSTDLDETKKEIRSSFSNFPPTISAPGTNILLFDTNGNPCFDSGTSFAAPQVAGLVALIKSIKPDATYEEVLALLQVGADDVLLDTDPNPFVQTQTWKRINVEKTLRAMLPSSCKTIGEVLGNSVTLGNGKIAYKTPDLVDHIYDIETGLLVEPPCESPEFLGDGMVCYPPEGLTIHTATGIYTPPRFEGCYTLWAKALSGNTLLFQCENGTYLTNLDTGEVWPFNFTGLEPEMSGPNIMYFDGSLKVHNLDTGSTYELGTSEHARISGNLVTFYSYDGSVNLNLVDITDPTNPIQREIYRSGYPVDLTFTFNMFGISGNYVAYATPDQQQVQLYDVASGTPRVLFSGYTPGVVGQSTVQINGGYVTIVEGETKQSLILCPIHGETE